MSIDAGGLAQMTYNTNFAPTGGLGVPGSGFASRGKGAQLKRLSVMAPSSLDVVNENGVHNSASRTSRSHLLAGLRTAPKSAVLPASAPFTQTQHGFGSDDSVMNNAAYKRSNLGVAPPQTTTATSFPGAAFQPYGVSPGYKQRPLQNQQSQQVLPLPEQVLAPPPVQLNKKDVEGMDPVVAAQLVATELYLAQRQQQLQQQLLQLTNQQLQTLSVNPHGQFSQQSQYPNSVMTPQTSFYNPPSQNGMTFPQEVPGQPGLYLMYNQLTGQYGYVTDPHTQQSVSLSNSPPPLTPGLGSNSTRADSPAFRQDWQDGPMNYSNHGRSSPPKSSPSPPQQDVEPLPPPSANAFRRNHKKASSFVFNINTNGASVDGPKTAYPRTPGLPQTPMTGTFGPGQGRAGEHPVRQPRGPPPFEELAVKPTSKHDGSKNFVTRQRRRAVNSLVRAGIERRGGRAGSNDSQTPVSEKEFQLPTYLLTVDSD